MSKKLTLTLFTALFILMLSVNGQGILSQKSTLNEIDTFIVEQMEIFHVPGLSACIIKGDSVAWNNNYGFMDLEDSIPVSDSTLFNVFSIGKSITSACIMQLWDKQLLGLDQNVNDFLPFQVDNPGNDSDSISARMLMNHSASLKDGNINEFVTLGDPTISLSYFIGNFYGAGGVYYSPANFYNLTTGTAFHYSNYGIGLLGYLVEPLTGIEFKQYSQDSMFTPLGMNASAWFLNELNINNLAIGYDYSGGNFIANDHRGHPAYPGISFRTTALELANFVIMLLNDGIYNNNNILSSTSIDSMTTIQNPDWTIVYGTTGLGIFQRDDYGDRIVWGHNGGSSGGYAAHYYFCKEENTGIVITTNSEQYVDPIVEYLFDFAVILDIPQNTKNSQRVINIFPNPVSDNCTIKYELSQPTNVSIKVYSCIGKELLVLQNGRMTNGYHKLEWSTAELTKGIYFCKVKIGNEIMTKKIIKTN